MRRRFVPAAFIALSVAGGGVAGCIDTDTAVFVDATIDNPTLAVTPDTLGFYLAGSYELTLHLGARASGPSSVSYQSFSLASEGGTIIIESLPVTPSAEAPVSVEPGGTDTVVSFTIDTGDDPLASALLDQVCAGPLIITGVIDDSLATSATPVESEPFSPSGC